MCLLHKVFLLGFVQTLFATSYLSCLKEYCPCPSPPFPSYIPKSEKQWRDTKELFVLPLSSEYCVGLVSLDSHCLMETHLNVQTCIKLGFPKWNFYPFTEKKYRLLIKAMLWYETHHAFSVMLNKSPFIITHKNQ